MFPSTQPLSDSHIVCHNIAFVRYIMQAIRKVQALIRYIMLEVVQIEDLPGRPTHLHCFLSCACCHNPKARLPHCHAPWPDCVPDSFVDGRDIPRPHTRPRPHTSPRPFCFARMIAAILKPMFPGCSPHAAPRWSFGRRAPQHVGTSMNNLGITDVIGMPVAVCCHPRYVMMHTHVPWLPIHEANFG